MVQPMEDSLWTSVVARVLVNTVSYPIDYAKVLIQIGYEPIPPRPTTTIFGRPALALPNIFQYVRYIKSVDGFTGCYRGLTPKLCAYTVSNVVFKKTSELIEFKNEPNKRIDDDELTETQRRWRCIYGLLRDIISTVVAIIVSHPLDVIAVRTMARFVGGEAKYTGVFTSDYYSGIVPRLVANVTTLVIVSASSYAINKYINHDRELKTYTDPVMVFICNTLMYPLHVVSHCMMVNNCGLVAGLPPHMPIYRNWQDCWTHLSSINQLKRGSSLLLRYYTGPKNTARDWRSIAVGRSKFKRLE